MMLTLALSCTFLVLAAVCKAVADTLTHHYDTSVFKWKDRRFWDPAISWKYAKYLKFTKYKLDAWHLANSGMIICFIFFGLLFPFSIWHVGVLLAALVICGGAWVLAFNLFYNKLLRRK
jgi:hypothetical protein